MPRIDNTASSSFARRSIMMVTFSLAVGWTVGEATAVPFDDDDFLISGFSSGNIAVYDSDLTFKGMLDPNFRYASGLDFDAAGNLVAVNQGNRLGVTSEVRVYDSGGTQLAPLSFANADLGGPFDLKVGPAALGGNYYVGTGGWEGGDGLVEFTTGGATGRTFELGDYQAVAVLPGNVLWTGGDGIAGIEVYDLLAGSLLTTIALDNDQIAIDSAFYSSTTNTVLIADASQGRIYERETDGTFVRFFASPGHTPFVGVTRGPGGDVFGVTPTGDELHHWDADGTLIGVTDLSVNIEDPADIVWTGNIGSQRDDDTPGAVVPEPTTAALAMLSVCGLLTIRTRK